MNATTIHQPPALDIDKILHPDGHIHARGLLERRIVWNLLKHLEAKGFYPILHCDGEDDVRVKGSLTESMELTFNLDECRIYFGRSADAKLPRHAGSVLIILGNGIDCISDWSWRDGETDFHDAMDAFDPEDFA